MKKILLFIMIALASASAQADMALKFLGTADANDLSQLAQELMADTGVAVSGDFGCFELPVFDLESGNSVGIGVDCLNIFGGDDSIWFSLGQRVNESINEKLCRGLMLYL